MSITRSVTAAALSLLVGLTGVAAAQSNKLTAGGAPLRDPTRSLSSLHAEAIVPVLDEMGLRYQGATLPNGQKVLLAEGQNGIRFQLMPMACEQGGNRCRGLSMMAIFETNASARTVSAFNYRYAFISAGMADEPGVAFITRYEIADYGLPAGNLAVSIANYLHMAAMFDAHLYESAQSVRTEVSNTDMAANALNMRGILANADLAQRVGLSAASHEVAFEMSTDVVDTFIKADKLSPGRLINSVSGKRQ